MVSSLIVTDFLTIWLLLWGKLLLGWPDNFLCICVACVKHPAFCWIKKLLFVFRNMWLWAWLAGILMCTGRASSSWVGVHCSFYMWQASGWLLLSHCLWHRVRQHWHTYLPLHSGQFHIHIHWMRLHYILCTIVFLDKKYNRQECKLSSMCQNSGTAQLTWKVSGFETFSDRLCFMLHILCQSMSKGCSFVCDKSFYWVKFQFLLKIALWC